MENREFGLALRLAYDLSPHSEAGEAVWELLRKYAPDAAGGDAPGQTPPSPPEDGGVHTQGGGGGHGTPPPNP